ncbi:MAG: pyruvate dehydrogenase (acetyl-transferring), homodimeric type [Acidobacteriota bacterium]
MTYDLDPRETREWLESLEAVVDHDGPERARFLLTALRDHALSLGAEVPQLFTTPYVNTIAPADEPDLPGDPELEERLLQAVRWNAAAMVLRAQKRSDGIGGHIATFQAGSTLFEIGLNHFFRAPGDAHRGDLVFFQGHASPGMYSRAFLEGRLSAEKADRFRQEAEPGGLSSYPHPSLMPDFWQFATVSMGLAPLTAIYQARFLRYLHQRGIADTSDRYVWCYVGDGESDEPETKGCLTMAAREKLDNLIFVVSCNLQRLDGPVRGNGKIVQELEGVFRGSGWNVIKVLWGAEWDEIFARDTEGLLQKRLSEIPDGEMQAYAAKGGGYMRQNLFNTPELARLVEHLSDDELSALRRGGHDAKKVHAAYRAAIEHKNEPTVILAQTVKGYGMGDSGQGLNIAHQAKKMDTDSLRQMRDLLGIPIEDAELDEDGKPPYWHPGDDSPVIQYLHKRRELLGGPMPSRRADAPRLEVPALDAFGPMLKGSGEREQSTTMGLVRAINIMVRDKNIGRYIVPIVPDEARTFGMEGLFRQLGIYAPGGQTYEPVDAGQLLYYREAKDGQILQEGINEAGATASWTVAATSYASNGVPTIPIYTFYSMFGFQRVGDFIWAAADMQARGFLIGATAGRTTLNGEGLQHEDGHSHLIAATVPSCVAYDPTYNYELAVILQDGLRRMLTEQENVFYYITSMNENYPQPALPDGAAEGILKGMYRLHKSSSRAKKKRVQLLGSGTILREVQAAAEMLENDHGIAADVWSVTSFTELRRDGLSSQRWNLLHPEADAKTSWVASQLGGTDGPIIASTDYMHTFADQIRPWIDRRYVTLGTDGFGRSDSREALRDFFEVDRRWVTVAALKALADDGVIEQEVVSQAIDRYGIDPEKPEPTTFHGDL